MSKSTSRKVRHRRAEHVNSGQLQEVSMKDSASFEYSSSGRTMKVRADNLVYQNSSVAVIKKNLTSNAHQNETSRKPNPPFNIRNANNQSLQNTRATESKSTRNKTESTINAEFSEFLYNLWQNQSMCDVIIFADGVEYKAHKLVLAARSEKFFSTCCEQLPPAISEVSLSNSSAEAVEDILRFIYTSEISLNANNIERITGCAKQLGITSALELCKNYLLKFDIQTVFTNWHIAEKYEINDILTRLENFICDRFSEVYRSSGFLNGRFEQIWYFVSKDNIRANSDLELYLAAAAWIDYNKTERLHHAPKLMSCVRFYQITPDELSTVVETADHIFRIQECRESLLDAYRYHALKKSGKRQTADSKKRLTDDHGRSTRWQRSQSDGSLHKIPSAENTSPQKSSKTPPMIASPNAKRYTTEQSKVNKEGKCFSPFNVNRLKHIGGSELSDPPSLPLPPRTTTLVTVGGVDPFNVDSDVVCRLVEQYNPTTDSWRRLSDLPESRHHSGVAMLGGFLYVIGGSDLNKDDPKNWGNPTDICFRFDPVTLSWSRIAPLRQPRMYLSVCVLEGVLYALGGNDSYGRSLDSVEFYDPHNDVWGLATPMTETKHATAAAAHRGLLFVVGGFHEYSNRKTILDTVECYNPRTHSWLRRNPLTIPCGHASLVEAKDNLYLIGGTTMASQSTSKSLSTVFRYLETDDCWVHLQNMRIARHDAGVTVIDSLIYIVGGANSDGKALCEMECLYVDTMVWVEGLENLSHPAAGIVCCSLQDEIS